MEEIRKGRRMKTLYIHIGTPKTATTSLQHFCEENESILEEKGYCYPIFPHKFKHVSITRNGFFISYKAYDEDGKRNYLEEEKFFRQGMDFVLDNFRKFDNVILSDEAMWSVVFKRGKSDLWEKIRKEADEHGYIVKVIVYLRRQDKLADSWWNQKVKNGKRIYATSSWDEFISDPTRLELNYYEPIKCIEQSIGKENIIVRRFGKQYFKNGSIFEDFADALGIRYSHRFIISEEDRNIRLFGNIHEIKRVLNMLPELSDQDNTFFRRLSVSMSEQREDWKGETMFSAEEALEFMEQYREGNRKVMREYFGKDEDLFDMDFSDNKKWVLDNTEMERDIISLIGNVTVRLRQENRDLHVRMRTMEEEWASHKKKMEKQNTRKKPLRTVMSRLMGKG